MYSYVSNESVEIEASARWKSTQAANSNHVTSLYSIVSKELPKAGWRMKKTLGSSKRYCWLGRKGGWLKALQCHIVLAELSISSNNKTVNADVIAKVCWL